MKKILLLLFLSIVSTKIVDAQEFTLDADLRSRFEYRHGFGSLFPQNAKPGAFIVQRSRLNMGFNEGNLSLYFSAQDVSTWGDEQTLTAKDNTNSFSLFQAWIKYTFAENWAIKVGRQTLFYDDQRIFGEVDWAMQGRFHDAALLQFSKDKFKFDLALAYNQEKQNSIGTDYSITGGYSYKTMQMAHLSRAWDKSSVSFLFLNNGFQNYSSAPIPQPDGLYYRQTTGAYFTFPLSVLAITGSAYLQTGMANASTDLSGYQYMLEAKYKTKIVTLIAGFESMSGTDQVGEDKNHSFFPLYGTNHKFNGYMDYFYVGNHANNVGLTDVYAKISVATGENSTLGLDTHLFFAAGKIANDLGQNLGTELDLVYGKVLGKNVKLAVGYSHMFATESMSAVKGGTTSDNTNNWGWVQLTVNPRLLSYRFKEE